MRNNSYLIRYLSLTLLLAIFVQITLGAWVRLTGSGMSCPDWPLCYGMIVPTYSKVMSLGIVEYTYFQIFLEWIHRANAAFLIGHLSIAIFFIIIFNKNVSSNLLKHAYWLMFLLTIQGMLGGLTVFKSNIPWSVAVHLVCAILLFYVCLKIFLKSFPYNKNALSTSFKVKVTMFLSGIFTILTASAGAFTSKYGASLSCNNWPSCGTKFFPNLEDMFEVIHFSHRVFVLFLLLSIIMLSFFLMKYINKMTTLYKYIFFGILFIISSQIFIGALLIHLKIPIWLGIFHQGTGLILFSLISTIFFYTRVK